MAPVIGHNSVTVVPADGGVERYTGARCEVAILAPILPVTGAPTHLKSRAACRRDEQSSCQNWKQLEELSSHFNLQKWRRSEKDSGATAAP